MRIVFLILVSLLLAACNVTPIATETFRQVTFIPTFAIRGENDTRIIIEVTNAESIISAGGISHIRILRGNTPITVEDNPTELIIVPGSYIVEIQSDGTWSILFGSVNEISTVILDYEK
jgi:hypothetical protein